MEIQVAARQVADESGALRQFTYWLLIDQLSVGKFILEDYGVSVRGADGQVSLPRITTSAVGIDELLTQLVEQAVSPTTLKDVVEDWLAVQ